MKKFLGINKNIYQPRIAIYLEAFKEMTKNYLPFGFSCVIMILLTSCCNLFYYFLIAPIIIDLFVIDQLMPYYHPLRSELLLDKFLFKLVVQCLLIQIPLINFFYLNQGIHGFIVAVFIIIVTIINKTTNYILKMYEDYKQTKGLQQYLSFSYDRYEKYILIRQIQYGSHNYNQFHYIYFSYDQYPLTTLKIYSMQTNNNPKQNQKFFTYFFSERIDYNHLSTFPCIRVKRPINCNDPDLFKIYEKLSIMIVSNLYDHQRPYSFYDQTPKENLWVLSFPSGRLLSSFYLNANLITGEKINILTAPNAMCLHNTKLLVAYNVEIAVNRFKVVFFNIYKKKVYKTFEEKVSSLKYFFCVKNQTATNDVLIYKDDQNILKLYDCDNSTSYTIWNPRESKDMDYHFALIERKNILISIEQDTNDKPAVYIYNCALKQLVRVLQNYHSMVYPMQLEGMQDSNFYILKTSWGTYFVMHKREVVDVLRKAEVIFYLQKAQLYARLYRQKGQNIIRFERVSAKMLQRVNEDSIEELRKNQEKLQNVPLEKIEEEKIELLSGL